jgi:hypothetical protein
MKLYKIQQGISGHRYKKSTCGRKEKDEEGFKIK